MDKVLSNLPWAHLISFSVCFYALLTPSSTFGQNLPPLETLLSPEPKFLSFILCLPGHHPHLMLLAVSTAASIFSFFFASPHLFAPSLSCSAWASPVTHDMFLCWSSSTHLSKDWNLTILNILLSLLILAQCFHTHMNMHTILSLL